MLTNSIIISIIRYASPILISSSNIQISKLPVLIMKCSRPILGYISLKFSTQKIMQQLKWLTAYQLITKESVLFMHKVIFNNQPQAISDLITFSLSNNQNHRAARKPIIIDIHNSKKVKKSLIYMGTFLYNKLPLDIKNKNPKRLSKYLQDNIHHYFPFDRILNYDPG